MHYMISDELRRLFQVAYERNRLHHLCLVTTLFHGLRVSETIQLVGPDVQDGQLSIFRLKKSRPSLHPLHIDADPLLDESPLIDMAARNSGRLFPFSRQRADQFIKRYAEIAGIHRAKAHMHALKHSIAILIWEKTHSLGQIQSYIGHKSPSSTLQYLVEIDARKAQQAVAGISI